MQYEKILLLCQMFFKAFAAAPVRPEVMLQCAHNSDFQKKVRFDVKILLGGLRHCILFLIPQFGCTK